MFSHLNVELSSKCNKSCSMCGRRKMEREHPELCDWGFMDFEMVRAIARQVPNKTIVQLHNNGEPTLYPYLDSALAQFKHCFRQFNTNGKLIVEKANEIIENMDVLTISVVENDPEADEQYETVKEFLSIKGSRKPGLVYRLLGRVSEETRWRELPGKVAKRVLHAPGGSYDYEKEVTIPEIGVCLDLLTHLSIDRYGNISLCVRFDPKRHLIIGNVRQISLFDAFRSPKRMKYIEKHLEQKRDECPGCNECHYYGCPRGE